MVAKLEAAIAQVEADLEKASAAGNEKKVKELEENLASRQAFLDMAQRAAPTTPADPRAPPSRAGSTCGRRGRPTAAHADRSPQTHATLT